MRKPHKLFKLVFSYWIPGKHYRRSAGGLIKYSGILYEMKALFNFNREALSG